MQTKSYLKWAAGADTSKLAGKTDLCGSNAHQNKLDVDKLITIPADLSELSDVENDGVVKETCAWWIVLKVNAIDTEITATSGLVFKTQYRQRRP